MIDLFLFVLNMSLKAGYVILFVMLIRLLLKKAPKFISYILWSAVAFRLLIPFSFESILSIMPESTNTNQIPRDIIYQETTQIKSGIEVVDKIVNNSLPAQDVVASVNPIQIYIFTASFIWFLGILVLLIFSFVSIIRLKKQLKDAQFLEDNIFEANNLKTPFVLGVITPKIYLPAGLNVHERTYIVLHEQTHIRRKDHVIKTFAFLILSIHWFNPLVWIAFVLMSMDMELSCDEHVLKKMKEDVKKPYANSLLSLAMGGHIINGSPLAFGEGNVKGRIKNVLKYRRPSFWVMVGSIIIIVIIGIALITNPKQGDSVQKDDINVEELKEPTYQGDGEVLKDSYNQDEHGTEDPFQPEDTFVKDEEIYSEYYNKVMIKLASDMVGFHDTNEFETSNSKVVAQVDTILRGGESVSIEPDLNNNYTIQYAITLSNGLSASGTSLYYDTLNNKAYFQKHKGLYEIEADFVRYIGSFLENKEIDLNIDDIDARSLFETYGWTLNYKISSMKQKINNIESLTQFNPNAYYFAYNNELSKDIGLDMSGYSNSSEITVDIYRVYESMPQEFYPIQNSRGIIVKKGDKIIGAFISAGRHSAFYSCSLKGNSFKKVTGQNVNEWIADMVVVDKQEERIAKLEPEQIIEEYFLALDNKDANAAQYYISRSGLLNNLTSNMANEKLFNEGVNLPLTSSAIGARSSLSNLKSAKLLKVELINDTNKHSKTFAVTMDMRYKNEWAISSGEQLWNCLMVYESPQTGWKIEEFGH